MEKRIREDVDVNMLGLIHLIVNMWSLWMVGPLLENLWGRWNYLAIYLLSGLCGSCAMAARVV